MSKTDIYTYGFVVSKVPYKNGILYAELEPAGSVSGWSWFRRFLPSVGQWWYEVNYKDEYGVTAHLYQFDGGAFTLHKAVWGAINAVQEAEEYLEEQTND